VSGQNAFLAKAETESCNGFVGQSALLQIRVIRLKMIEREFERWVLASFRFRYLLIFL
jgi:hypothetical protein